MDEDERYRKYYLRKWCQGKAARPRKEYEKERDTRERSRDFGNQFRDGMCQLLGRTEDQGWKKEALFRTSLGARWHDSAKGSAQRAMEFKAGGVGKDALKQLDKDAVALDRDWVVEWYVVPGAKIDKEVQAKMAELSARFPDQFRVITVTREQFAKAIELGKELAKQREAHQKALDRARERAGRIQAMQRFREGAARARAESPTRSPDERAQTAELAKARQQDVRDKSARELAGKKASLAKTLEDQARYINEKRDKGQAVDLAQVRDAHTDLRKNLKEIREAERAQAIDMLTAAGYPRQQAQTMQAMFEQERERQRRDVVRGINTLGVIVERADEAADKSRGADKAPVRETGRELTEAETAERERVTELQRLYREGQARPPYAAVEIEPDRAPGVQRGGTGMVQHRDRGRSRDR